MLDMYKMHGISDEVVELSNSIVDSLADRFKAIDENAEYKIDHAHFIKCRI